MLLSPEGNTVSKYHVYLTASPTPPLFYQLLSGPRYLMIFYFLSAAIV